MFICKKKQGYPRLINFAFILILSLGIVVVLQDMASAAMFGAAEMAIEDAVKDLVDGTTETGLINLINVMFASIRTIFWIAVVVAIIGVINSIRQGEEWKSVFSILLLVLFGIALVDWAAGFIF